VLLYGRMEESKTTLILNMTLSIKSYIQEESQVNIHKYITIFYLHEDSKKFENKTRLQIASVETDKLSSTIDAHDKSCKDISNAIYTTPQYDFIAILEDLKKKNKIIFENEEKEKDIIIKKNTLTAELNQQFKLLNKYNYNTKEFKENFEILEVLVNKYNNL